jgi:hypothetical protein
MTAREALQLAVPHLPPSRIDEDENGTYITLTTVSNERVYLAFGEDHPAESKIKMYLRGKMYYVTYKMLADTMLFSHLLAGHITKKFTL